MSEIKITPQALISLADEVDGKAKVMKAKLQEAHTLAKSLQNVWQDTAQEEYDKEFAKLSSNFDEYLASLPGFVQQAKDHAQAMINVGK